MSFTPPTGTKPAAAPNDAPTDMSAADMGPLAPSHSPIGQQAPSDQYNYTPTGTPGEYAVHEPGASAPIDKPQINTRQPVGSPEHLSKVIQHLRSKHGGGKPSSKPEHGKAPAKK